jgi:Holliday junction DNA helicase RuvA
MLSRLTGTLLGLEGPHALVEPAPGIVLSVLLPAYLHAHLGDRAGTLVTFHTRFDLEGTAQGTSLTPRLVGFLDPADRAFFELFTSVKGLGVRRALRALAEPPSEIAGAVARRDTKALTKLPEIGKRLAETVTAELHGKVDRWLLDAAIETKPAAALAAPDPLEDEAIAALVALGQSAAEAERLLARARTALGTRAAGATTEDLLAAAFGQS